MFENGKSTLKNLLEVNQGRVAVTTDLWMDSNQKKRYMALTAYFVDGDWILQNLTLRYAYLYLIIKLFHNVTLIIFLSYL